MNLYRVSLYNNHGTVPEVGADPVQLADDYETAWKTRAGEDVAQVMLYYLVAKDENVAQQWIAEWVETEKGCAWEQSALLECVLMGEATFATYESRMPELQLA